ncbi:MAG: hypothetical protein HC836_24275 [Richelia sp. RM2_1_2]|nr:hypothetical protein [Richelia sp. RM2_1_2]
MKEKKPFVLPDSFLKQLKEFSGGGFVLIIFDEDGNIKVYEEADTSKDHLALSHFGADYFECLMQNNKNCTQNHFFEEVDDGEDEEEEDHEIT